MFLYYVLPTTHIYSDFACTLLFNKGTTEGEMYTQGKYLMVHL